MMYVEGVSAGTRFDWTSYVPGRSVRGCSNTTQHVDGRLNALQTTKLFSSLVSSGTDDSHSRSSKGRCPRGA